MPTNKSDIYTYDPNYKGPSAAEDEKDERLQILRAMMSELGNFIQIFLNYLIWHLQGGHFTRSEIA